MAGKNALKKARNYYDLIGCDFEKSVSDRIEVLATLEPEDYSNSYQDFKFLTDVFASESVSSKLKEEFNQNQPLWVHKFIYATFWYNLLRRSSRYLFGFDSGNYYENMRTGALHISTIIDNLDSKTMIDLKSFYLPHDAKSKARSDHNRVSLRDIYKYTTKISVVFQIQMMTIPGCLYNNTPFELEFSKYSTILRPPGTGLPTKEFLYHGFQGETQFKF